MEKEVSKEAEVVKEEVPKEAEVVKEETSPKEVKTERTGMKKVVTEKLVSVKHYLMGLSKTTKSFIVVIGLFAVVLGIAYFYKGVFVVATVNGTPISRLSVVKELEKKAGKDVLDTIITKKLIQDEIKKSGIVIKDGDVTGEIDKIKEQVSAQGGTLEEALTAQGMTEADLREQIVLNKALEQILSDKIAVTDEEVTEYLSKSKTALPKGTNSDDMKNQVREQLKGQKFNTEAGKWLEALKSKAQINYFMQY
ncbi:MAG: hypothetical protein GW815_03005 [Candidatus Moranbacteria bacterium]|nr:hypothetical protein [Candidatus Moranbacteria bacterium]